MKTLIPAGRRKFMPGEIGTSVEIVIDTLASIDYVSVSSGRRARKPPA